MIRLKDIPKLSPSCFSAENMIRRNHATPCYRDIASGMPVIESPWVLVGWSDRVDQSLMHGREGQTCLMLFHPEVGEYWQHYPFLDDEERDAARFLTKNPSTPPPDARD